MSLLRWDDMSSTKRCAIVIVMIVALVPLAFGGRWAYHQAKAWRAQQLAHQAMTLLGQHDLSAAEGKLRAAYNLSPFNAEVLRICGKFSVTAGDPQALEFYRGLLANADVKPGDRRDAVAAALAFNNLPQADEWAEPLNGADSSATDKSALAQVRWDQNQHDEAIGLMRKAVAQEPDSHAVTLLLARMLHASRKFSEQKEALTLLHSLGTNDDAEGLTALELLAESREEDQTTRQWILSRLKQHPLLDDNGRFAIWDLEIQLGTPTAAVTKEVTDTFKSASTERRATAGRWLNGRGASQQVVNLIPLTDAMADRNLLLVRLDALAYLKNWSEVQTELNNPDIPLPQSMVYLYRARADRELNDPVASAADWNRAIEGAAGDAPSMTTIGQYAAQMGVYDQAEKAFQKLASMPGQSETAYRSLIQIVAQHGTTTQLRDTLQDMIGALPTEAEPRNDWAYVTLLLNENVDTAFTVAKALEQAHPELLAFRSTLALAYLRRNDPANALKVYDNFKLTGPDLSPSWKTVHAAVLGANGSKAAAMSEAEEIDRAKLRPEEVSLLDEYVPQT